MRYDQRVLVRLPIPLEFHLTGRLSRSDHDPFRTRVFSAADGDAWLQAKRVARVDGAGTTWPKRYAAATDAAGLRATMSATRRLGRGLASLNAPAAVFMSWRRGTPGALHPMRFDEGPVFLRLDKACVHLCEPPGS